MDGEQEPPASVTHDLEEALELLAVLEAASVTLWETERYAGVVEMDAQIQLLSHRLGFDDGGTDGY